MGKIMGCLLLLVILACWGCGDPCAEVVDQAVLAAAAAEAGAVRSESGLIFKSLAGGYGPKPQPGDRVTVHYEGKLADGTVFDSSRQRGRPATFDLDRVIPGWSEGLLLMKGAGRAKLVIPPHLGYGQKGKSPDVPPCAVLIFEIELLGITSG